MDRNEQILKELDPALRRTARKKLADLEIEVISKVKAKEITAEKVILDDGREIATENAIWTAGARASERLDDLDLPHDDRKGLKVDAFMRVEGHDNVWGIGDCAANVEEDGTPVPPNAQAATQEGRAVARNVLAAIDGGELEPFDYKPLGQLVEMGSEFAVNEVLGIKFSGRMAAMFWRMTYLYKLESPQSRARIAADWLLGLFYDPAVTEIRAGSSRGRFIDPVLAGPPRGVAECETFVTSEIRSVCLAVSYNLRLPDLVPGQEGPHRGDLLVHRDARRQHPLRRPVRERRRDVLHAPGDRGRRLRPGRDEFAGAFAPLARRTRMDWRVSHTDTPKRMAILVSRYDHCLIDLLWRWDSGELDAEIPLVVSNHPDLASRAEIYGIPFHHLPVTKETKAEQEERFWTLCSSMAWTSWCSPATCRYSRPRFVDALPERDHQHPPLVPPGLRRRRPLPPGPR